MLDIHLDFSGDLQKKNVFHEKYIRNSFKHFVCSVSFAALCFIFHETLITSLYEIYLDLLIE